MIGVYWFTGFDAVSAHISLFFHRLICLATLVICGGCFDPVTEELCINLFVCLLVLTSSYKDLRLTMSASVFWYSHLISSLTQMCFITIQMGEKKSQTMTDNVGFRNRMGQSSFSFHCAISAGHHQPLMVPPPPSANSFSTPCYGFTLYPISAVPLLLSGLIPNPLSPVALSLAKDNPLWWSCAHRISH